jgi:hypothetical protein
VFKRELGVPGFLDLDHQRHSSFGAAKRERLTCVLVRDGVDILAVAIGAALYHATTKLHFLVGIIEIDDGERDALLRNLGASGNEAKAEYPRFSGRLE